LGDETRRTVVAAAGFERRSVERTDGGVGLEIVLPRELLVFDRLRLHRLGPDAAGPVGFVVLDAWLQVTANRP
jgi:hypothetical protein